ncbi:MAG: aldo/keto reductase [Anaerolineae bacterium]|jgi:aryl-alcohol dehydrogenase-like predicted oxidoreductase
MLTRKLGKSGIDVSAMGMGCWAIGGPWWWSDGRAMGWSQVDDAESIRAIHAALDLGITFFDTAANYGAGHSEQTLGRALAGRRDQVVIATKFGHIVDEETKIVDGDDDLLLDNIRQDCENSLRRLNTDYIDVYQLHAGSYPAEEAIAVRDLLEALVAEGKIRAYGWSTDHVDRARVFARGQHCASIQFSLNVFHDNPQMRALCDEFDVGSINKKPLSSGILTGKFTPASTFPRDDFRRILDFQEERYAKMLRQVDQLRQVLTSEGRTLAQGAIAWIWARSERAIPIPGFKTVAQVEENAGAMAFGPLSREQLQEVEQILERETP